MTVASNTADQDGGTRVAPALKARDAAMSTLKQLYEAGRAVVHARLTSERESVENNERWCIAWQAEAAKRELRWTAVEFWREGSKWIWAERAAGRRPAS